MKFKKLIKAKFEWEHFMIFFLVNAGLISISFLFYAGIQGILFWDADDAPSLKPPFLAISLFALLFTFLDARQQQFSQAKNYLMLFFLDIIVMIFAEPLFQLLD